MTLILHVNINMLNYAFSVIYSIPGKNEPLVDVTGLHWVIMCCAVMKNSETVKYIVHKNYYWPFPSCGPLLHTFICMPLCNLPPPQLLHFHAVSDLINVTSVVIVTVSVLSPMGGLFCCHAPAFYVFTQKARQIPEQRREHPMFESSS